jgi:hypothetical protein
VVIVDEEDEGVCVGIGRCGELEGPASASASCLEVLGASGVPRESVVRSFIVAAGPGSMWD